MKMIAVIGANGRSGNEVVKLALARGYHVKASIHSGNELEPTENLEIISGIDATKQADVAKLINGSDAVVSVIGHGKNSPDWLIRDTTQAAILAMREMHVRRFVSLTGTGVRVQGDKLSFADRLLHLPLKLAIGQIIKDGIAHKDLLKEADDIDWTIIRALILSSGESVPFSLKERGPARLIAPRTSVAEAIIDVIEKKSFIQQLPIISKKV